MMRFLIYLFKSGVPNMNINSCTDMQNMHKAIYSN